jgi:hypothetical protein
VAPIAAITSVGTGVFVAPQSQERDVAITAFTANGTCDSGVDERFGLEMRELEMRKKASICLSIRFTVHCSDFPFVLLRATATFLAYDTFCCLKTEVSNRLGSTFAIVENIDSKFWELNYKNSFEKFDFCFDLSVVQAQLFPDGDHEKAFLEVVKEIE